MSQVSKTSVILWLVMVLSGCGGEEAAETAETTCSPGQSVACACEDDNSGEQQCLEDGSGYQACVCSNQDQPSPEENETPEEEDGEAAEEKGGEVAVEEGGEATEEEGGEAPEEEGGEAPEEEGGEAPEEEGGEAPEEEGGEAPEEEGGETPEEEGGEAPVEEEGGETPEEEGGETPVEEEGGETPEEEGGEAPVEEEGGETPEEEGGEAPEEEGGEGSTEGAPDSCVGNCDVQALSGCWCDILCQEYEDCCDDYEEVCLEAADEGGEDTEEEGGENVGGESNEGPDTCDDEAACNFGQEGDCYYPEEGGDCEGTCEGSLITMGGGGSLDQTWWNIKDCDGAVVASASGNVNGVNVPYTICAVLPEIYTIEMGDTYGNGWNGNVLTVDGVEYTGPPWGCESDPESDGVGNGYPCSGYSEVGDCASLIVWGCMDTEACNYSEDATQDDDSCVYAGGGLDCDGNSTCDGTWVEDITYGECNEFDSLNGFMEQDCVSNDGCTWNFQWTVNFWGDLLEYFLCQGEYIIEDKSFCDLCGPNWTGENCDICANGWQGESCDSCADNWTGEYCDTCSNGWQGESCDSCPDNWTGENCDTCSNGWQGESCDSCADNWTGENCDTCSNGWEGETCSVCPDNWTGNNCESCNSQFTGPLCDEWGGSGVVFSVPFGGTVVLGNIYTFPSTNSDSWGGFANEDTSIYPFVFPAGGTITFDGTADQPVDLYFKFEKAPHPDVEPSFATAPVTVEAGTASYTVDIPAQDAANTYSSFLLYLLTQDVPVTLSNVTVTSVEVDEVVCVENGEEFTVGSLSPLDECDNQCTCLEDGTWGNCTTNSCPEDPCAGVVTPGVVCKVEAAYCMSDMVAQPKIYHYCQPSTGACVADNNSGNEPVFCDSYPAGFMCIDGACVPPTE